MYGILIFELKKVLKNKTLVTILSVFLLVNISLIGSLYLNGDSKENDLMAHNSETKNLWTFYNAVHKEVDGVITEPKTNWIVSESVRLEKIVMERSYLPSYNSQSYTGYTFGDYYILKKYFYEPLKYALDYESNMDLVVEKSKENIELYEEYNNKNKIIMNHALINAYSNRKISELYDTVPWEKLIQFNYSDLFVLLLVIYYSVVLYYDEEMDGMSSIILSTNKGKIVYELIKPLALLIYVTLLVIMFVTVNYLMFKILFGLNGSHMPLYSIETYKNSPFTGSIRLFISYMGLLKIIGLFSIGIIVAKASSIISDIKLTYLFSIGLVLLFIWMSTQYESYDMLLKTWSILSPVTLLRGEEILRGLDGIVIGNKYIITVNISMTVQLLFSIALLVLCNLNSVIFKSRRSS